MADFDTNQDVIDSRDIVTAIEEMESDIEEMESDIEEMETELSNLERDDQTERDSLATRIDDMKDEIETVNQDLLPLTTMRDECEACSSDWQYGVTLINDNYFEEYAQELAADIGGVRDDWPHCHIDWGAAANSLQMDYTSITLDGKDYWFR